MSSYSCQNYDHNGFCRRLKKNCLPGQPGCIMREKFRFAFDPTPRLNEEKQKRATETEINAFRKKNGLSPHKKTLPKPKN